MASVPVVQFGRDVPLPADAQPFGLVFDATARTGNQVAANGNASVGQNPPGAMAIYAITGNSTQAAGFLAHISVTRDNVSRVLASLPFPGGNFAGTAQRPHFLHVPEVLNPGDMVTVEFTNLAAVAADIELVLWGVMV